MKKTIMIPIEVDAEVFAIDLANSMNYEEAINIIKIIDIQMADWEFTKQLAAYFMNEILKSWEEMEMYFDHAPKFVLDEFISYNLPKSV